jgi:hypothetical protein
VSTHQAQPGERLASGCGHHCGIRSSADEGKLTFVGHCPCPECACVLAAEIHIEIIEDPCQPPGTARVVSGEYEGLITGLEPRVPMCESWYARSGGVKPWD